MVYGLLTTDKHNEYTNEYLSDEFLKALAGKKLNYSESDIEKVKIDSFISYNYYRKRIFSHKSEQID